MENALILPLPLSSHLLYNILIMQVRINILDVVTFCVPHYSFCYPVTNTFLCSNSSETMPCPVKGHCLINLQICHYIFQITVCRLIGDRQENLLARFTIPKQSMSDSEIMVILILFHSGGFRCFKHYYPEYVCKHLSHLFPVRVSYNRFVELEKEILLPLAIFIKQVLLGQCTGISFADSTPLRVCRNQRIHIHKTFEGLATRGKCSMGWFFGFKLHLIINDKGEILNFMFTPGGSG